MENKVASNQEYVDKMRDLNFILENRMVENNIMINNLKAELEKYYLADLSLTKEIYIADPDRINLELYNELNCTRDIMSKISKQTNFNKDKTLKYELEISVKSKSFLLFRNYIIKLKV